ncbi:MAG: rhodanese-like domain-containing protein [Methylococcales bacterium]|nr:rhodanese-like domain-containing protein [Methylococcales bacterium]
MRVFLKYCQISSLIFVMGSAVVHANEEIASVSPKEAATLYADKKAVIVDVRDDSEWQETHIPGAIHIPLAQLDSRLSELKQYQDSPVITQCRSGGRSAKALEILKSAGFSKVYNLDGGLIAWDKAGLKTE